MSTLAARDSSPGFFFPLVRLGPATRRHSPVSDDVPRRRDEDRDAERRVFFLPFCFVVGHSDGIFKFL